MNKTNDNKKQSLNEGMKMLTKIIQDKTISIKVLIKDEIINNLLWDNIITEASNLKTFLQMSKLNRISHLVDKVFK